MGVRVEEGFAEVGGGRLYYEVAGSGRAVVLIHAGMWDRRIWDDQFLPFAEEFRVVRYDVRGFGRSDRPTDEPYTDRGDLVALLRHLGIESTALVGASMGGKLALDFALEDPEATRALVLAAPALGGYRVTDPELLAAWAEVDELVEAGDHMRALELELGLWAPLATDPAVDARIRRIALENIHLYESTEESEQPLDPPAAGRLGEVGAPTLVVVPAEDRPHIREVGDILASGIPDARKVVIEAADHLVNMRRPERFNRAVLEFLREHA